MRALDCWALRDLATSFKRRLYALGASDSTLSLIARGAVHESVFGRWCEQGEPDADERREAIKYYMQWQGEAAKAISAEAKSR